MTEILLDYDSSSWAWVEKRFRPYLQLLRPLVDVPESVNVRKTRRGYHVRIILNRAIAPREVVSIQSALGDDPRRTRLILDRMRKAKHRAGLQTANRLWEEKFRLDGTLVGREGDAPGEERSLRSMFFPDDLSFQNRRNSAEWSGPDARSYGSCPGCGKAFEDGDGILWKARGKWWHRRCRLKADKSEDGKDEVRREG